MDDDVLYENSYMSLFVDGTIGLSDGCGYVGTMEEDEVDKLYKAMTKLYKEKEKP